MQETFDLTIRVKLTQGEIDLYLEWLHDFEENDDGLPTPFYDALVNAAGAAGADV